MKNIANKFNEKALAFVGTNAEIGYAQFEILKSLGMEPHHKVLEIGCGALNAAVPIVDYLDCGGYTGIEPNSWLVGESLFAIEMSDPIYGYKELLQTKKPCILYNESFDATETGQKFDYIFAHSIMSHAAHWQLNLFLENCAKVLAPGGQLVFSLLLCNESDRQVETMDHKWHYPDSVWIGKQNFETLWKKHFNTMEERPDITRMLTDVSDSSVHDWVLMQNK